jgi:hypothetical protein
VPRAACLAWLTSYRTPLFFAQAVGRVVRSRGRHESATVFLPAVRPLLRLAAELEDDRNHVLPPPAVSDSLDPMDGFDDERPERAGSSLLLEWEALEAEAQFAHVLHGGRAVTAGMVSTESDDDFLGLPGLLSPEQTAVLLAQRDGELRKRATRSRQQRTGDTAADHHPAARHGTEPRGTGLGRTAPGATQHTGSDQWSAGQTVPAGGWRAAAELRREVNRLVAVLAARTGTPHGSLHARLRAAVPGPASASASVELLEARREHLMAML